MEHLIRRLRDLHSLGYVHCNLKPENAMVGMADGRPSLAEEETTLIDFMYSHRYLRHSQKHEKEREAKHFKGTLLYCSRRAIRL